MLRRAISILTITCIACLSAVVSLRARQAQSEALTIEITRKILAQPLSTQTIAGIPLVGFEFSREIEVGGGRRVVAISCTRNGGLIAFGTDGKAVSSLQTGRITSLEIFDLTEDGNSEVILNEVEGTGTGVLMEAFVVYRLTSSEIRQIWKGDSVFRSAPWKPAGKVQVNQKTCFLRFDPSGAGQPATMTHVCTTSGDNHFTEKTYEWRGDSLQERRGKS
jgi:hypothetical protein